MGRKRKNRKLRRGGKVLIPDWTAIARDRAAQFAVSHRRRLAFGIKLAVAALVVYAFVAGPVGSVRLINLYRERARLQAEDRRLTIELVELDNIRRRLEVDTTYIEKVAREEYGFSRPEEIIFLEPQDGSQ